MSPIPIASVTRAPQASSSARAEAGLAAAGLAGDEHLGDARAARSPRLGQVLRRRTGVATTASGCRRSIAISTRSVLPVAIGMWQAPMRSNDASAAPAANGPAL